MHQYAHSPSLSEEFEDMMWWAMEGPADNGPKQALRRLNVETTVLRKQVADFFKVTPNRNDLPVAIRIYRKAKALDFELGHWFEDGPHLNMRRIDRWQEDVDDDNIHKATAYPGKVYDFDNIFIGAKFLSLHLHRLVLAEIMLEISTWIENCGACLSITCTQRQDAMALAKQEISEIIAIVPFYCKWPSTESPSPFGGMTCSFPVFVAGSSAVVSEKQKAYLVGRLSFLSQATGLKLVGKFAEVYKRSQRPTTRSSFCLTYHSDFFTACEIYLDATDRRQKTFGPRSQGFLTILTTRVIIPILRGAWRCCPAFYST